MCSPFSVAGLSQKQYFPEMDVPLPGNWVAHQQSLDSHTMRFTLGDGSRPLSVREVIELWRSDEAFRQFYARLLSASTFRAFFWETPPLTTATLDREFEFVLVGSSALVDLQPEAAPFAEHFSAAEKQSVLAFPNLGGDAMLVVPVPIAEPHCYPHLAAFLRNAPAPQTSELWRSVGEAVRQRVSNVPLWLSTAGLGVSWLHLRLDSRPKYYRHLPYKSPRH
jgi:hypothetical protein